MTKRVAVVTGASRGIGRAIAEGLVADGFFVVGTATSESGAVAISDYLGAGGKGMRLDVSDSQDVEQFVKAVSDEFGAPWVLVNNAGITRDNLVLRMKEEDWEAVIQTNLTSVFRLSKGFMRGMMKAKGGRIINISSVVAAMGNAGQANYAASKGGMEALTRSLARELGSRNITVNAVAPGFVDTDMTRSLPEAQREAMIATTALARFARPDEIAGAVRFLASDAASYITGVVLPVNGGMYM
ncbi:3-oxoacyl-ACP reductase FabG [Hahella sp. SMD15-11]|uniref:3-oxoacyl-[acyl-carrier-protein] reductase n=1 Tax=Thermohahella caldifontis TaxID=3142973 RepID=A0AB39UZG0_9GAMM